ncbi:MAG: hypothetical protein PHW10_04105 [Candidatus Peribacteraceae bacterium]|nr:hypothetical protein [Candidatus Peribacteraceae bacterium]
MPRIRIATPAGDFQTDLPETAAQFLRSPEVFGYQYGERLRAVIGRGEREELAERLLREASAVNGSKVEIAAASRAVVVTMEHLFRKSGSSFE